MGVLTEAGDVLSSIDVVLADNHTAMCAAAVERLFAYPDLTDAETVDLIAMEWSSTYGVMGAGADGYLDRSPGSVFDSPGFFREYGCAEDQCPDHWTETRDGVSWTVLSLRHPALHWTSRPDAPDAWGASSGEVWSLAPQWAVFGEALPEVEAAVLRDGGWSIDDPVGVTVEAARVRALAVLDAIEEA